MDIPSPASELIKAMDIPSNNVGKLPLMSIVSRDHKAYTIPKNVPHIPTPGKMLTIDVLDFFQSNIVIEIMTKDVISNIN